MFFPVYIIYAFCSYNFNRIFQKKNFEEYECT